jgi:hypothetical protein
MIVFSSSVSAVGVAAATAASVPASVVASPGVVNDVVDGDAVVSGDVVVGAKVVDDVVWMMTSCG